MQRPRPPCRRTARRTSAPPTPAGGRDRRSHPLRGAAGARTVFLAARSRNAATRAGNDHEQPAQELHLIWPSFCQVRSTKGPHERAFLLVGGAAGRACARRAVSLICAGWVPQDRVSSQSPPSRIGCHRRAGSAAHRCVTDALARRARARRPARPTCCGSGLVGGGDRPAEAGELARAGDGDDRAALVALLHARPDVMQAPLGLPGDRDDLGLAVALAASQAAGRPGVARR